MARLGRERATGGVVAAPAHVEADPNYEPNYGAAAVAGVRNAASGLAGLGDLAYMAGDALVGDDPIQSEWDLGGKTSRAFDPLLPTPGWEPTTTGERFVTGATEAGTAFLVPGGAGVRYISQAPKLAKGIGAFGKAATENYGRNAARLGAANLAASQAGQYAQSQDMGTVGQVGLPMAAAILADPATGLAMSMRGRNAARQAAQAALPQATKGSSLKLAEGLQRRILGRIERGEVTVNDVIAARDFFHDHLTGRVTRITNEEIRALREAGDDIGADMRQNVKSLLDTILEELDLANQSGRPLPTTAGVLGGADVQLQPLQTLSRSMGAEGGNYSPAAVKKNEAARDAVAREALDLAPGVQGTSESVRAARDRMKAIDLKEAGDPWESDFMFDVLNRTRPVGLKDYQRVVENIKGDPKLSQTDLRMINFDEIWEDLKAVSGFTDRVSAFEFNSIIQKHVKRTAEAVDMPKNERRLRNILYKRMRRQLESRIKSDSPGDYESFKQAKKAYREHIITYDPKRTSNEIKLRDMERLQTSQVAEALGTVKGTTQKARSYIQLADELSKIPGEPEEIAKDIRRVMRDDPDALAEVEQNLWRALLGDTADPKTTSRRLFNEQRELEGVIDLDDEGKTLAIYRALAGDEKADAVPEIVKAARQARFDPAGTNAAASMSGSIENLRRGGMIREAADTAVSQEWKYRAARGALKAIAPDAMPENIEKVVQQAMLDPKFFRELLDIPDGEAFKEWRDRWVSRTTSSTTRESVKGSGRKKD